MRLLKAVFAGLFVLLVGFFTAVVIAMSAVAIFIGRRLRGSPAVGAQPARTGDQTRTTAMSGEVIDVTATEVPEAR